MRQEKISVFEAIILRPDDLEPSSDKVVLVCGPTCSPAVALENYLEKMKETMDIKELETLVGSRPGEEPTTLRVTINGINHVMEVKKVKIVDLREKNEVYTGRDYGHDRFTGKV